jgi:hypothetical protein
MYDSLDEWGGCLDAVFTCFGRNILRKKYGRALTDNSDSFGEEVKEFMDSGKFNINDIEGSTKRLLLSFTDEVIKDYCEDEDLDEEDTNNLLKLFKNARERMGEGRTMLKPETKAYVGGIAKDGGKRGALRSLTKTVGRSLSEIIVKKGGGGSSKKEVASATRIIATFFETDEGRAVIATLAARGVPYIAEKMGKAEVGAVIARELDTEAFSVVAEKATDAATMLAQLGLGELTNLFSKFEETVDVSPKALSGSTVEPVPGAAVREEEMAGLGRR